MAAFHLEPEACPVEVFGVATGEVDAPGAIGELAEQGGGRVFALWESGEEFGDVFSSLVEELDELGGVFALSAVVGFGLFSDDLLEEEVVEVFVEAAFDVKHDVLGGAADECG